jgi:thiamine-monophosphate kinase
MRGPSERQIIEEIAKALRIAKKQTLWNDDVSTVRIGNRILAIKCDMFVRSTDAPRRMKVWQMARKSIVSCVSDLACKGVRPLASLVSLGIPHDFTRKDLTDLANGFKRAEREFHVNIIGGDTNECQDLVIDCSMIGLAQKIIRRSGARIGDLIITSGAFGYSSSGLKILQDRAKTKLSFGKKASDAVLLPDARMKLGLGLANYASSSMDSSDGLAITLNEMSEQSKKKFIIHSLPTTDAVRGFAKDNGYDVDMLVMQGGEEYEIVATIPRHHLKKVRALAKKAGCRLFVIGRVARGRGVFFRKNGRLEKVEKVGWEHLL